MDGLGKVLRDRGVALGLSDSEVARRAGLSQARYHNYVSDQTEPDLATLMRICRTLSISPNEALSYDGPIPAPTGDILARQRVYSAVQAIEGEALALMADMLEALVSAKLKVAQKGAAVRKAKSKLS